MGEKTNFGELLVESKLLTENQLQAAVELQKNTTPRQTIGRFIVKQGFMTESDLQLALDRTGKRQRLEEIYYRYQFVSKDDLILAMEMARQEQAPISTVLKNLEFIDEEVEAQALAIQYDLQFMHIDTIRPSPALANVLKPSYARNRKIVPIARTGDVVKLAMAAPLGMHELKELEALVQLKIQPVIALEQEVAAFQEKLFSRHAGSGVIPQPEMDLTLDDSFLKPDDDKGGSDPELDARKVTDKDSNLVKLVNKIVCDASAKKASDIHIEPYPGKEEVIVRLRIDGKCEEYLRIPHKYKYALPSRVKIMADLDIAERRKPQDGKINFKKFGPLDVELRVATMPTAGGLEDVVIRVLNAGNPTPLEELGLSDANIRTFTEAIKNPYGLVLVVGPTGSGKTTTLHSAIAEINRPNVKVWTAEDPVEITQRGLRQVQINPKIGFTFAAALRSFLRLDPDVIMVGEMRDEETASIAVEASLTGHLVFSTLHTNTAPDTITRLLEIGLDPFSFSDALQLILAQRLARKLCVHCAERYTPPQAEINALIEEYGGDLLAASGLSREAIILSRPVGCASCADSGYLGRIGIHELFVCSDELRSLIKKKADTMDIRRLAIAEGMMTLKQDGILKVLQGLTDIHEIRRISIK